MMTSEPITAFVWIWLPDAVEPVVCGRLDSDRPPITFTYGRRYLDRSDAVPIFDPELPPTMCPATRSLPRSTTSPTPPKPSKPASTSTIVSLQPFSTEPRSVARAGGRAALLVERFDREPDGRRRRVVSALTVLGYNTFPDGRYATYAALAHAIRSQFERPDATLRELFARISFNVLCGNTDDHGRNHAAFVGADALALTPAYDISPQPRSGNTAQQEMAFTDDINNRDARLEPLVAATEIYHLSRAEADEILLHQIAVIRRDWDEVCDAAELTGKQSQSLLGRQFLNEHAFAQS